MNTAKEIKLTAKEIEFLNNLDKVEGGRNFGQLQAKKYLGKGVTFANLNTLKAEKGLKYVGTMQMLQEGGSSIWYFNAINGETYRIPEPQDGIDEFFELEFKRKKLE